MGTCKLAAGACLLAACLVGHGHQLQDTSETQLFRQYALALCLAASYKGETVASDAVAAMNGYREFGSSSLDAYHALNPLLSEWQKKPYRTKAGSENSLARCIDFSHSKEVAAIQSSDKDGFIPQEEQTP